MHSNNIKSKLLFLTKSFYQFLILANFFIYNFSQIKMVNNFSQKSIRIRICLCVIWNEQRKQYWYNMINSYFS